MSKLMKYAMASAVLLAAGCGMQSTNTDHASPTGPTPHSANMPVVPSENPNNPNPSADHSTDRMIPAGGADRTATPGTADRNSTFPPPTPTPDQSTPGQDTQRPNTASPQASHPGNPLPDSNK